MKIKVTSKAGPRKAASKAAPTTTDKRKPMTEPTARERRAAILDRLYHYKYSPFDLLSWESLLCLLHATKSPELGAFGGALGYVLEQDIHRSLYEAALRRAAELDVLAGSTFYSTLLRGGEYTKLAAQFKQVR